MSQGEIKARHYATGRPITVRWQNGQIVRLSPASSIRENLWIAPPLFDLQVNGYGRVDFQQDGITLEQLRAATRELRSAGCSRFLLTLVTAPWPLLLARLEQLRALRAGSKDLQRAIAGWHVEGPFLSAEPGFCGAHKPGFMLDPKPKHLRELRAVAGRDPLMLTLAPERRGALPAIALARSLGITISLGHTNATAEMLRQAVSAGATGFTHLGNGCPQALDRHENILWRALDTAGLTVSLIPDQIHVAPALFRLVHRALASESIYYTTDAMAAAGAPPGRYRLGPLTLEVGADQIVRYPGKSNFAGSALRPIDGVIRAAQMLNQPWQSVWPRFSTVPAKFLGQKLDLEVGQAAEFCLVRCGKENQIEELQVLAH
jgi:N-acetylglucosamine-6-phosphate deacetylase